MIEAGDVVYHKLTNGDYLVLGRRKNEVCVVWPPAVYKMSDCVLRKKRSRLLEVEIDARKKIFGGGWK